MISTSIQPPANPARQPRNRPSPWAMVTDRSPTSKATRLPKSTRERISRPNSSAPRRNLLPGRARFSIRLCLAGSAGASHGAPTAATTSRATTTSPAKARRLRRKRCQASAESVAGAAGRATITPAPTAMLALPRDPRVQRPVGEVDREVDDHEGEGEDEHRALEQHVVAGEDRLDHEAPDPGPGEDGLGEHRSEERRVGEGWGMGGGRA